MDIQGNPLDVSKTPSPELSPKMQGSGPRFKKILIKIMIALLAFAVIGGAGYAGYKLSKKEKVEEKQETTEPAETKDEEKDEERQLLEDEYYVTAEPALNLRRSASTSGEVLTIIPYGTIIKKEETSSDGKWFKVTFEDKTGYVSSDFCKKDKPPLPDIRTTDFVALGRISLNGGVAEPVLYHDFTSDNKVEAIVKVKRGNLYDYYVFGYIEFELKSYLERKGLSGLTISYSGQTIEESSTTSGSIKWKFEGGEFKQGA